MCKSHTKKIGALKLSQQDVGKNCIFRGCVIKGFCNGRGFESWRAHLICLFFLKGGFVFVWFGLEDGEDCLCWVWGESGCEEAKIWGTYL